MSRSAPAEIFNFIEVDLQAAFWRLPSQKVLLSRFQLPQRVRRRHFDASLVVQPMDSQSSSVSKEVPSQQFVRRE